MNILLFSSVPANRSSANPASRMIALLAGAYEDLGHKVRIFAPCHEGVESQQFSINHEVFSGRDRIFDRDFSVLHQGSDNNWQIRCPEFFARVGVFDEEGAPFDDNYLRFAFLASAVLEFLEQTGEFPELIHTHEWNGAFLTVYAKEQYGGKFASVPQIFSIQDLTYDYAFPENRIPEVFLDPAGFDFSGYEFWGKVSLLKLGILYADGVSFPSNGYLQDVLNGLDGLSGFVESHASKMRGIQNGFDYSSIFSDRNTSESDKSALQRSLGLDESDSLLMGCISRNTDCACLDLIATVLSDLAGMNLQLALEIHPQHPQFEFFTKVAKSRSTWVSVTSSEDTGDVGRELVRSCDSLLLASDGDPSGVRILEAMAHGTIPVVNPTGGFRDPLVCVDDSHALDANGFFAKDVHPDTLLRLLRQLGEIYSNHPKYWKTLSNNARALRVDWKSCAQKHLNFVSELDAD